jgi:hypothetical protein
MMTVVQLRTLAGPERPRAELLFGTPFDLKEGTLGPVARFESGELVAYQIRSRRRRRLFVFRTLEVDDALAVVVPGVRPRVQLLMEFGTAGRIRLAKSLFAYLVRTRPPPSAMPDIFYLRVAAALGGRLPGHKILRSLLPAERPSRARESSTASNAKAMAPAAPAAPTRAPGRIAASTGKSC